MTPEVPKGLEHRPSTDPTGSAGPRRRPASRRLVLLALVVSVGALLAVAAVGAAQWPQEGRTPTRNASAPTDGPSASWLNEAQQSKNDTPILWSANPGREHADGAEPMVGAPVIEDNLVVVATEGGTVAAYGALQGQQAWSYQVPASDSLDDIVGTPAIVEDLTSDSGHLAIVGARDGVVRALDLDDGQVQWTIDLDPDGGDSIATSIHAREGRVFLGMEEDEVVAIDTLNRVVDWRNSDPFSVDTGFASAETSEGDWLYVPASQELYRFRPGSGNHLRTQVGGNLHGAVGVSEADERLYYGIGGGDASGEIVSRNASNFKEDWTVKPRSVDLRSDALRAGDSVYVGSERGTLYAREAAEGAGRWSTELVSSPKYEDAIRGLPAEANGTLFVPSEDGLLFGVDAGDGEKLWTLNLRSGCGETQLTCGISSPAVWEEKLYVTTEGGVLWVVGPESAGGPQPPTAEADVLERGLTVDLDASASTDPNGDDLTYTWRLGDGTTAQGEELTYTYRRPGNYTVTLVAEDPTDRSDTSAVDVEVQPRPSTTWTGPGGDRGADRATPDQGPPAWTEAWKQTFPSPLVADPLVGAEGVVAAAADGAVRSYELTGRPDWDRALGDADAVARGNGSVYVATGERIQALDAADGADVANLSLGESVTTVVADGDRVAAADDAGGIAVWNTSSGANWTAQHGTTTNPDRIRDGPVFGPDGDLVAVLTVTNNLHVYEADDGSESYAKTELGMEARQLSVDEDGVVLSGLTSTTNAGEVRSIVLETGVLQWTHETSQEVLGHAAAGERVYAATAGDRVVAVDRRANVTEDRQTWSASLEAAPRGDLAASDEAVVVPTDDGVRLLDPDEGGLDEAAVLEAGTTASAVHETVAAVAREAPTERSPALIVAGTVPYEANFTWTPSNVTAGETVRFEDASVAASGASRTFELGDGSTVEASGVSHVYEGAGTFVVNLTVESTTSSPTLLTRQNVTVDPAPDDGNATDGNETEPPDGNVTDPGDGTDGNTTDGGATDGGDGDDGTPYQPDAGVAGFEAVAALAALVGVALRRRHRS